MALGWGSLAIGIGGVLLGGLGTELWRERRAVSTARRIRRDQESEAALQNLIAVCAQLESQVDFMLSPERFSVDGYYNAGTITAATSLMSELQTCWRVEADPFLPAAEPAYKAVDACWTAVRNTFGWTNPPMPSFFDRLRDLRVASEDLRTGAQHELLRPSWRRRRTRPEVPPATP